MNKTILIAEDDEAIRLLLNEVLQNEGYTVFLAENGVEAINQLESTTVDLIISDINMPIMNGFELLSKVADLYPNTQRVLMTAYNVDDYMHLIQKHNIGNIVTKGLPFNTTELILVCEQIFSRQIFGLAPHLEPQTEILCSSIKHPDEINELSSKLTELYGKESNSQKLNTVLMELLTNALFYGAKDENPIDKSSWNKDFTLGEDQSIKVYHGRDDDKTGFSIVDNGGKLNQKTILYWLDRQLSTGENGLPQGIFDTHGRGLFITRQYVDRLIVNVEKGKRCEVIILNYTNTPPTPHKPLRINEI